VRATRASSAWTRPFSRQWRHHLRHHRLIAIFPDAHLDFVGEVDAVDLLQEAMNEMLAGLLAFGDDVDAGIFLQLHRQHGGVALGARQLVALGFPGRPQRVGFGQPFRLRQGAGDRGWKQHGSLPVVLIERLSAMSYDRRTEQQKSPSPGRFPAPSQGEP